MSAPTVEHYAIRGGTEGRARLRVLARVMHRTTASLFDQLGVRGPLRCLDVGCGGGDVTLELARRTSPHGYVIGVDMDDTKLELARQESQQQSLSNVEFRKLDIRTPECSTDVDLVYARFLLTHLQDPSVAVAAFYRHLRPGGVVIVEDVDFNGYFTYPESAAFRRYHELYCAVVKKRGGDPNIGPRLPLLLSDGGFENVGLSAVQPIGTQGEVKLINPLTMENIAESVIQDGLASGEEINAVLQDLYAFAENPRTVAGVPRVVQAWGYRPSA